MLRLAAEMVSAFKDAPFHTAWSAARPLVGETGAAGLRALSRDFSLIDHGGPDRVERFLSILGGKATTLRAMAEITADRTCQQLGIQASCSTAEHPLRPARRFYSAHAQGAPASGTNAASEERIV